MKEWKIYHDKGYGFGQEQGDWETWTVSDGKRNYKCYNSDDAKWLCELLNKIKGE